MKRLFIMMMVCLFTGLTFSQTNRGYHAPKKRVLSSHIRTNGMEITEYHHKPRKMHVFSDIYVREIIGNEYCLQDAGEIIIYYDGNKKTFHYHHSYNTHKHNYWLYNQRHERVGTFRPYDGYLDYKARNGKFYRFFVW